MRVANKSIGNRETEAGLSHTYAQRLQHTWILSSVCGLWSP